MKPLVSVIVPNYNHARFLNKRINSVLEQTYQNFELIILDDSSTDNSKQLIEQYREHPRVTQIVYNEANSGTTFKQWQKGLNLAKGELIWIAESDDYCEPTFLQTTVDVLDADKTLNLFFTRSYQVDENNKITSNTLAWSKDRPDYKWDENFEESGKVFIERCMVQSNIIVNASAVVFRKSAVLDDIFTLITPLRKMGDWLFWVHCVVSGRLYYWGRQPLNYFREHHQSTRYLPDLKAVMIQKVEKYFVLRKIRELLPTKDLQQWVDEAYFEMVIMTPVNGYTVLKETLQHITGTSISYPTYLYRKIIYSVPQQFKKFTIKK